MSSDHSIIRHPAILALCLLLALAAPAAMAATTELHVVRYAADGVTILNETTVDYRWLESNLPVQGDGVTHYYHQGPVFEGDKWNPEEDTNVLEKDMGAVKGTDLKDICGLVGGMKEGETVRIKASDGLSRVFPYRNVYEPEPRQGPMVITWYHDEDGYVPDYYSGMRLVFFADTSTNPYGVHAFGVWDMHECFDEEYWYFYGGEYPTTTGLSVQYISEILIYSEEEPTGGIHVNSTPSGATIILDGEDTGYETPYTLTGIESGSHSILVEKGGYVQPDERWVTVGANQITEVEFNLTPITGKIAVSSVPINASIILDGEATGLYTDTVMEEVPVGEHTIELVLPGYRNATRTVVVEEDEYSILDLVLIPVNESVPGTLPEASMNATPGNATLFSLLGPFEFHGRVDVLPANISTTPSGSVVSYRLPDGAKGRGYIYIDNRSAGEPDFEGFNPDRRYTAAAAATFAANLTGENSTTFTAHCPPGVIPGGLLLTAEVDENASSIICWIGEGLLIPDGENPVRFEPAPDLSRVSAARLLIVGTGNITARFNGHSITGIPQGEPAVTEYDVLACLNESSNELRLEGEDAVIRNVILSLTTTDGMPEPSPTPVEARKSLIERLLGLLAGIFGFSTEEPEQNTTRDLPEVEETAVPEETRPTPAVTPTVNRAVKNHSGGVYITSYPPGMTIIVDNKKLSRQTPRVIYGLREGLHTIQVEASTTYPGQEEPGYRFETVQAWVYPDAITPVHLDGVAPSSRKTVRVESEAYRGERFTLNGIFRAGTIPDEGEIEGGAAWVTVLHEGRYLSSSLPTPVEDGMRFVVEPWTGETVSLSVRSNPPGAPVFIDGFPTDERTPCRMDGLSPGRHRILVSMPGYLPAEEVITIPEGSRNGGVITCTLQEYTSGGLLVESNVPDARIYLYGRYTGEKTPHTFTGMSIGTYEVRVVSENDSRTVEDVLVKAGATTRCLVTLEE